MNTTGVSGFEEPFSDDALFGIMGTASVGAENPAYAENINTIGNELLDADLIASSETNGSAIPTSTEDGIKQTNQNSVNTNAVDIQEIVSNSGSSIVADNTGKEDNEVKDADPDNCRLDWEDAEFRATDKTLLEETVDNSAEKENDYPSNTVVSELIEKSNEPSHLIHTFESPLISESIGISNRNLKLSSVDQGVNDKANIDDTTEVKQLSEMLDSEMLADPSKPYSAASKELDTIVNVNAVESPTQQAQPPLFEKVRFEQTNAQEEKTRSSHIIDDSETTEISLNNEKVGN